MTTLAIATHRPCNLRRFVARDIEGKSFHLSVFSFEISPFKHHHLIAAAPFLAHRMGSRKCRSLYALAYKERRVHLNTGRIPHACINERLQEHGTTLNKQAVQLSGMKESEYLRNYITRKIEHNLFYIFTKSTIITTCSKKDGWMRTVKQPQRCRQRVITVYDKTQRRTSCPMAYIKRRIIKQCGTRTDQNGVVHGT